MIGRRNIVRAKVLAEWATKDSPMPDKDFSYKGVDASGISCYQFATNFGTHEGNTFVQHFAWEIALCTVSSIGRASDS